MMIDYKAEINKYINNCCEEQRQKDVQAFDKICQLAKGEAK